MDLIRGWISNIYSKPVNLQPWKFHSCFTCNFAKNWIKIPDLNRSWRWLFSPRGTPSDFPPYPAGGGACIPWSLPCSSPVCPAWVELDWGTVPRPGELGFQRAKSFIGIFWNQQIESSSAIRKFVSKSKVRQQIESSSANRKLVSKSKVSQQIESSSTNRKFVSKSKVRQQIESSSANRKLISESNVHQQIESSSANRKFISKSKVHQWIIRSRNIFVGCCSAMIRRSFTINCRWIVMFNHSGESPRQFATNHESIKPIYHEPCSSTEITPPAITINCKISRNPRENHSSINP